MPRNAERVTDELLVLAARGGSEDAFATLHQRWHRRLLGHAYSRVQDPEAAQDIVQEAWLGIVRGLRELDEPERFAPWSLSIVTHKSADWIRSRSRGRRLEQDYAEEQRVEEAHISSDPSEHEDDVDEVQILLRSLTREKREVLRLFYLEELDLGEIAEALDLPRGTVKSRLFHGRKELKEQLERRTS